MSQGHKRFGRLWPFGVRPPVVGDDEPPAQTHPWKRPSRLDGPRAIHPAAGGIEPAPIKLLRDLNQIAPAPFTDQTIIVPGPSERAFELPAGWQEVAHGAARNIDVPILRIAGVGTLNNMHGEEGDTFGEALFRRLHGQGITEASIAFLCGRKDKSEEMPHEPVPGYPKTKSTKALELARYGEWFIVANGYQRAVIAMFAIWHCYGPEGKIFNVKVTGLEA